MSSSASAIEEPVATSSVREEFTRLAMDSNNRFRVKVKDGRLIEGTFSCIDSDENIILDNAVEYYGNLTVDADLSDANIVRRNLGMTMIAGQHITQVVVNSPADVV